MKELLVAWYEANARDLPWRKTTRPLRDPRQRGDAAADAGRPGRPAVPARGSSAGRRPRRSRPRAPAEVIVAWQGLGYNRRAVNLHRAARARRRARLAGGPDGAAGRRPVHRGRGRQLRVRARRAAGRHNVGASRSAPARRSTRRARRRSSTSARPICLARIPRCGACPLAAACPSRGPRYEPLRKQSRFEGSFRQRRAARCARSPPASSRRTAMRSCRSSATARRARATASRRCRRNPGTGFEPGLRVTQRRRAAKQRPRVRARARR